MKPVFQKPMDGKCVQASVASILGLRMDQVPSFNCPGHTYDAALEEFVCPIEGHSYDVSYSDGTTSKRYRCDSQSDQRDRIRKFVGQFGFTYSEMSMDTSPRNVGAYGEGKRPLPPGICIANGKSPRFGGTHAVVWDTRLVDFEHPYGRMVHDPYPAAPGERPGIGLVEGFCWLELVDTDLLRNLVALQNQPVPIPGMLYVDGLPMRPGSEGHA